LSDHNYSGIYNEQWLPLFYQHLLFNVTAKIPDIWRQDATEHFFGNNIFPPMGMIPPLK
jgi:hypothetical protein